MAMASFPTFYDGGFYPDPWPSTWVPKHFPEHHHAFEHARHSLSHALNEVGQGIVNPMGTHSLISPRVDCRETANNYYFDVELPGLDNTQHLSLRWIASRTLLIKAVVKRKPTPEDEDEDSAAKEEAAGAKNGDKDVVNSEHRVFLTMSERRIGLYGRAFNFSVDVDHDKTVAKLEAGLLRLTVPKLEPGKKVDKTVHVHNDDSQTAVEKTVEKPISTPVEQPVEASK